MADAAVARFLLDGGAPAVLVRGQLQLVDRRLAATDFHKLGGFVLVAVALAALTRAQVGADLAGFEEAVAVLVHRDVVVSHGGGRGKGHKGDGAELHFGAVGGRGSLERVC